MTIGPGAVAVHGAVAAMGEAQRRDGRVPWPEIVPAAFTDPDGGLDAVADPRRNGAARIVRC